MANLPLTLATRDYDFVAPLATGDVRIEGVDLTLRRAFEALQQVADDPRVHGGEGSFSRHVQRLAAGDRAFVGLPIFVMREFRHRNFYVRRGSPLRALADLAGRRVGLDAWPASGNTWTRALLRESGIPVDGVRWVVGRVQAGDPPPPADALPATVELVQRPLLGMLLDRELDALVWAWTPPGLHEPDGPVVRLIEDYAAVEQAYYRHTRLFPAHHIVVLRRAVWEQHPGLGRAVYLGFAAAHAQAARTRWTLHESSPWLLADLEVQRRLMGPGYEAYGVRTAENRAMVARFCEEQLAQGLIPRAVDPGAVFAEFEAALAG